MNGGCTRCRKRHYAPRAQGILSNIRLFLPIFQETPVHLPYRSDVFRESVCSNNYSNCLPGGPATNEFLQSSHHVPHKCPLRKWKSVSINGYKVYSLHEVSACFSNTNFNHLGILNSFCEWFRQYFPVAIGERALPYRCLWRGFPARNQG